MNIQLPAILMFTRGTRFWPIPISLTWNTAILGWFPLLSIIPVRENSEVTIICPEKVSNERVPYAKYTLYPASGVLFRMSVCGGAPKIPEPPQACNLAEMHVFEMLSINRQLMMTRINLYNDDNCHRSERKYIYIYI